MATSMRKGVGATGTAASFLARLRSETRALHERTERRIQAAERLHDIRGYARLLRSLRPLYASIELQLASFAEWSTLTPPLDLLDGRRSHLLTADLEALGIAQATDEPRGAPTLPDLEQFEHALGALYVVEGSRLGGNILARQVSVAVGEGTEHGLRFLRSDGRDVGHLWNDFRISLIDYAAGHDRRASDAIIVGAVRTFRCFDRQLALWQP